MARKHSSGQPLCHFVSPQASWCPVSPVGLFDRLQWILQTRGGYVHGVSSLAKSLCKHVESAMGPINLFYMASPQDFNLLTLLNQKPPSSYIYIVPLGQKHSKFRKLKLQDLNNLELCQSCPKTDNKHIYVTYNQKKSRILENEI